MPSYVGGAGTSRSPARNSSRLVVVSIAVLVAMLYPTAVALALAPNTPCKDVGFPSWFDGGPASTTTAFANAAGAEASISYVDYALCTGSRQARGSSAWVGVGDANDDMGNDIYQMGFIKCVYSSYLACDGAERMFFAWGRTGGVDGCLLADHPAVPQSLGLAPTGTHSYRVIKSGSTLLFQLDGSTQTSLAASNICWPATGVRFTGETWDRGDQIGGTVGSHQVISSALYYKSGVWSSPAFGSCTTDYSAEYLCSKVSGQRVDLWSDRS